MEDATIAKQAIGTDEAAESTHASGELYKVGVVTTATLAGAIGLWSVVCLASALFTEGGPVALVQNLVKAITG